MKTSKVLPRGWRKKFIEALRGSGNVRYATKIAGISRATVYRLRVRDKQFDAAWDDAIDDFADLLEMEANRRAAEGTQRVRAIRVGTDDQGRPVYERIVEREYSDNLLMFTLKALRPEKYRDSFDLARMLAHVKAPALTDGGQSGTPTAPAGGS